MDSFVRIHVREGMEDEAEKALREVLRATREEAGCVRIDAFRELRGGRKFYIHSTWKDEASFGQHGKLAHTARFIERMKELIDQEFEVTRAERIEEVASDGKAKQ